MVSPKKPPPENDPELFSEVESEASSTSAEIGGVCPTCERTPCSAIKHHTVVQMVIAELSDFFLKILT